MAKSIDLLLLLFGSFLCLHISNSSIYVNQAQTQAPNPLEQQRVHIRTIYTQEIGVREKNNKNDGDRVGVYRKRRPISSIYQVADWITPLPSHVKHNDSLEISGKIESHPSFSSVQ